MKALKHIENAIEIFLVEEIEPELWITLARPGRRLKPGKRIEFGEGLTGEVAEKMPDGKIIVRFAGPAAFLDTVEKVGRTPLPPYIRRERDRPDPGGFHELLSGTDPSGQTG